MQQKWYIIDSETKGGYSHHDPIKFLTKSIKSSLCDYSDGYILVTGNIAVKRENPANTADSTDDTPNTCCSHTSTI